MVSKPNSVSTRCWIELISSQISPLSGGGSLQIVKILRAPKLLRVGRLFKALLSIEGAANIGRIFLLMGLLAMLIHWLASINYVMMSNTPGSYLDRAF